MRLEVAGVVKDKTVEDEVFDLKRSNYNNVEPFLLAPRAYRYLDLVHTRKDDQSRLYVDFLPDLPRLRVLGFGTSPGNYHAQIFATAEGNAEPDEKVITWSWNQEVFSLRIPS